VLIDEFWRSFGLGVSLALPEPAIVELTVVAPVVELGAGASPVLSVPAMLLDCVSPA